MKGIMRKRKRKEREEKLERIEGRKARPIETKDDGLLFLFQDNKNEGGKKERILNKKGY